MAARTTEDRLGTVERHTNLNDQRLTKLEGLYESVHAGITNILAFQQAHSERLTCLEAKMDQRFETMEKLIRESLNGRGT